MNNCSKFSEKELSKLNIIHSSQVIYIYQL
jgi:hypothetical protein